MKSLQFSGVALSAIAACLAAGALSGCNPSSNAQNAPAPSAALPLAMDATPVAIAPAPTVSALPAAAPVRVGRLANPSDEYAYADQAYAANEAFGDAPPDYAIDYEGTRPWIWRGDDQSTRVAEALPGGGYRYYYYGPGAQYPYLVRDPEYTYGYDSGALVVVYDRYGRPVPNYNDRDRVDAASRILARAALLFAASQQMQHQSVYAAHWQARQDRIQADNRRWAQAQQQQPDWNAYHVAHLQQEASQWGDERYRREAAAARFAQQTNQPQVAQRDWQAAQKAHGQAAGKPAGPFGFGGSKPPPPVVAPANGPPSGSSNAPPSTGPGAGPKPPAGPPLGAAPTPATGPGSTLPPGRPGAGPGRHDRPGGPQGPRGEGPRPTPGAPVASPPVNPTPAEVAKPSTPKPGLGVGARAGRHDHGLGPLGAGAPHPTPGAPMAIRPSAPAAPPSVAVKAESPRPAMPERAPKAPVVRPPVDAPPHVAAAPPAAVEHRAKPMPVAPPHPAVVPPVHAQAPSKPAVPPAPKHAAKAKPVGDHPPKEKDPQP